MNGNYETYEEVSRGRRELEQIYAFGCKPIGVVRIKTELLKSPAP